MDNVNESKGKRSVSFRTDPRIALILGEGYRSSEYALRELVDNAWDADASNVWVDLPEPLLINPTIVIRDDGIGMNEKMLRTEYLNIACSNYFQKGGKTALKQRLIRGRKGIGKFAGLALADTMTIKSKFMGKVRTICITKENLLAETTDITKYRMPIKTALCPKNEHGTVIELSEFNQKYTLPMKDKFEELMARNYTHEDDFCIFINGSMIRQQALRGETSTFSFEMDSQLVNGTTKVPIELTLTWLDKPTSMSKAGIVIKANGKTIGRPQFFGLDELDDIPRNSLKCLIGTIHADCLGEFVTPDWSGLFESAKPVQDAFKFIANFVKKQARERFKKEIDGKRRKIEDYADKRLKDQPEFRRNIIKRKFMNLMERYFKDSFEKIESIAELALNALERDEYFELCKHIQEADHSDIISLAKTLEEFGLYEITVIGRQANARIAVLDSLDKLICNSNIDEKTMHKILENNLWFFGHRYSLFSSNKTLKKVAEKVSVKYPGAKSTMRPDLIITQDPTWEIL